MNIRQLLCIGILLFFDAGVISLGAQEPKPDTPTLDSSPQPALTLKMVLSRVEEGHPLLRGTQTERQVASGKLLTALGQFEPNLVNDWELERLVKNGETTSVGFNDTLIEMSHPWGIKGFAGFRAGIGDVEVADLGIKKSNQALLGIVFPLLRGFITNPAHAELQKSSLANRQAELEIQRSRQDLYLGAATQYWNWVAAHKLLELQQKAVTVADARATQLTNQAKAGAKAQFDVIEANQEVQRRRERLIKAQREIDQEEYKLALFLWEEDQLVVPKHRDSPPFPNNLSDRAFALGKQDTEHAISVRPELQLVQLEAEFNHIDLDVAENNFLPSLNIQAQPSRKPEDFVLGLGYRFGAVFSFPFLQREARGDLLQMEGKAQRLKLLQQYRLQQVTMDVANAQSAITRAHDRVQAAQQSFQLAKQLEKGERTRFKLGATTLLFVNLRERNVLRAAEGWIAAMTDYQKALALYEWATGGWVNAPSFARVDKREKVRSSS